MAEESIRVKDAPGVWLGCTQTTPGVGLVQPLAWMMSRSKYWLSMVSAAMGQLRVNLNSINSMAVHADDVYHSIRAVHDGDFEGHSLC